MTKEEFLNDVKTLGYARADVAKAWCARQGEREYTEADFEEVYRINEAEGCLQSHSRRLIERGKNDGSSYRSSKSYKRGNGEVGNSGMQ